MLLLNLSQSGSFVTVIEKLHALAINLKVYITQKVLVCEN